jgi:hypothetical protein
MTKNAQITIWFKSNPETALYECWVGILQKPNNAGMLGAVSNYAVSDCPELREQWKKIMTDIFMFNLKQMDPTCQYVSVPIGSLASGGNA